MNPCSTFTLETETIWRASGAGLGFPASESETWCDVMFKGVYSLFCSPPVLF